MKAIGDKLERWARPHLLAKHFLDATHAKVPTCQDFGAVVVARQHPSLPCEMDRIVFPQVAQTRKWILLEFRRGSHSVSTANSSIPVIEDLMLVQAR
jgi:hypothetical protein